MSYLVKFLELAGVGGTLSNFSMLHRFLSGIALVIALTAIASVMTGALIIVGFYGVYLGLIHYGLNPDAALITVSGLMLLLTLALALAAYGRWRQLRQMPRIFGSDTPMMGKATKFVDAFMAGFNGSGRRRGL